MRITAPAPRTAVGPGTTVSGVVLKNVVRRLTTSVEEQDRQSLCDFCDARDLTPTTEIVARESVRTGGEIRSVRVVPRAGAPALEATVSDGRGTATAVFLGRRKIHGISPGRKIVIEGMAARHANRFLIFNPRYTLVP